MVYLGSKVEHENVHSISLDENKKLKLFPSLTRISLTKAVVVPQTMLINSISMELKNVQAINHMYTC